MKNLGCLLPYPSQNVAGNIPNLKTLFFWPKKAHSSLQKYAYLLGFKTYCFLVII